ncbi:hypothetical protein PFISCL1PPCAC_2584 [Pristionchus fissidentatus]|uniref:RING-type domain-containing protein n=1 Tax=Pristionchus fissidentatus TaxID=1538716 RepID=A0AAV5UVI4_9BILA|nr:hypothetical protein PFISCL1PPCAC_2584 [Pristionchus fissidentatus]
MADADYERDSRRVKKREAEARNHHNWYERKGPNVIIRSQLGGTRTSFEAEDAFDVSCDNVSHSLNKGKRWEKVANAERILYEQDSPSKTSFVKSSIPRTGVYCWMPNSASEVDPAAVVKNHGGVNQIIEVDNHEVSVRNAKSKSATLTGLQSKAGPGPLMKKNRHRARTVKGSKREEEGTLSDPSEEEQHTRYATLEINKIKPKDVERAWRAYQPQNSNRGGWTRKPPADDILDWYSEEQDALEDELDDFYEEQLESEEPLRFPDQKEKNIQKSETVENESEVKKEEFPLRENAEKRRMRREKRLGQSEEQEYRDQLIETRPALNFTPHLEEAYVKAEEWFCKNKSAECLPVFPRTLIVHKKESEAILGTKMDRCTFVAESNVPGKVHLYAAPKFCCNPSGPPAQPIQGWQSHTRTDTEFIGVGQSAPDVPSSSSIECPMCKGTEETEDADAVVVQRPLLFSINCGHVACHSCWVEQARQNARARSTAIKCVNPHCSITASISEASTIFSDGTIGLFRDFLWDSLCDTEGAVPCYHCPRLLIPVPRSPYLHSAICPCGVRTCRRCGLREHLPLNCNDYERWATMSIREGIHKPKKPHIRNPVRHLTPLEKTFLKDCRSCGAEDAVTWKNWCDKCCQQLSIRFEDPIDTHAKLAEVLSARARMMNSEYMQARVDRRVISKKKSIAMEKTIDDGVYLFELIAIRRILGTERALTRQSYKKEKFRIEGREHRLDRPLFEAMETGGDPDKKVEDLRMAIEEIREIYAQYCM